MRKAAVTRCLSALTVLVTDWNGEDYAEPAALLRVTDLAHGGVVPVEAGSGVN